MSFDPSRAVNAFGPSPQCAARGGPIVLTVTTGRSGSSFLARSFRESLPPEQAEAVFHELLTVREATPARHHRAFGGERLAQMAAQPAIAAAAARFEALAARGPVVDFGWTMSPLVPLMRQRCPDRLRVIVLYRHPVAAAASMSVLGLYSRYPNPDDYALSPLSAGAVHPGYARGWRTASEFEKCLFRWLEITAHGLEIAERFTDAPVLLVNSDLLFREPGALGQIAAFCGYDAGAVRASRFRNEKRRENLETNPLGPEWRRYARFGDAVALAERLGFSFEPGALERMTAGYRLPAGAGARLRHATGYWLWRRRAGAQARRLGAARRGPAAPRA